MLTVSSPARRSTGSRREFLQLGGLCVGGLTLADLLRLDATGHDRPQRSRKSVIMVWLEGGPSHVDIYDLKPQAPVEYRGEYRPIATNVPGFEICELLPQQARIADKLAVVRSMTFQQPDHRTPEELLTGFHDGRRPALGSVVSRLQAESGEPRRLPPYVQLESQLAATQRMHFPAYLGAAHKPFVPGKESSAFARSPEVSTSRLDDRRTLLRSIDAFRRETHAALDAFDGFDAFTAQAFEMIASPAARDAFDVSLEPPEIRERYGKATGLLQARRLVEAGVQVVSVSFIGDPDRRKQFCGFGGGTWDTHGNNFVCLGELLPHFDQAVHALTTDLTERGLLDDVAVVFWGEFGRAPRLTPNPNRLPGRDHWPDAGFAMLLGGGLRTGQTIGATDDRGGRPITRPYTAQNVLATLYRVLGIDPTRTFPDFQGRPISLLDDPSPIAELV